MTRDHYVKLILVSINTAYWKTAMPVHLCIACGCFWVTAIELSSCHRNCVGWKVSHISRLVLYWRRLLTSGLDLFRSQVEISISVSQRGAQWSLVLSQEAEGWTSRLPWMFSVLVLGLLPRLPQSGWLKQQTFILPYSWSQMSEIKPPAWLCSLQRL